MADFDVDAFVADSVAELEEKQNELQLAFGIGYFASFWFDQPSGTLEFRDVARQPHLVADVIPIGSHSARSGTWMWAWGNPTIVPALRERAECFRGLADLTGIDTLGQDIFNVKAEMANELAAMAVSFIGAMGMYRAPGQTSDSYLAITKINRVQPA